MKAEDCYDIVCNIDSIKNISNGWEFKFNQKGYDTYIQRKDKSACTVAVVGNANKGKSFILQKLAGFEFPSGFSVKTEGLSLKYPKNDNLNFILFDTAGLETPLIKETFYDLEKDLEKLQNDSESKEELNEMKESLIESYARDKQTTEFFLQSFVTNNANVLILIMNQMTSTDQILLNKVKKQCKKGGKLFVIHNLATFVNIQQCEDYIQDTLMKSLTFKLQKLPMIDLGSTQQDKHTYFYREEVFNNNNDDEDQLNVVHLIMANDGEKSEAGQYYNETCINFLRTQIVTQSNIKAFNIKDDIKKYFMKRAPDFLENEMNSIELVENEEKKQDFPTLALRNKEDPSKPVEVQLKKCLIDELGDESFQDSKFTPPHRMYKTEDKANFIIELELPGDKTLKPDCKAVGGDYMFIITGEKKSGYDKKKHELLSNKRDNGKFQLRFSISKSELPLKKKQPTKVESENGIVRLIYTLEIDDDMSD
jgi:HSP20 family molecular chaperone IbpA/GTPase SAR1 family protein